MRTFFIIVWALFFCIVGSLLMTSQGINGFPHMLWGALVGLGAFRWGDSKY